MEDEVGLQSYMWNVSIPTESLVVIYNTENILACKIPSFSSLSPGVNRMRATPMWSWSGLGSFDDTAWISTTHMASEVLYDPLSTRKFNLYYLENGIPSKVVVVTIPTTANDHGDPTSSSGGSPALSQRTIGLIKHFEALSGLSFHKGLYVSKAHENDAVCYAIGSLKGLTTQTRERVLRMSVPRKEFGGAVPQAEEMDMDEATGRVIIWGWDREVQGTKVFVGDLV